MVAIGSGSRRINLHELGAGGKAYELVMVTPEVAANAVSTFEECTNEAN